MSGHYAMLYFLHCGKCLAGLAITSQISCLHGWVLIYLHCVRRFSVYEDLYNITFISILFPFFLKFQPPKLRTQLYPGICSAQISLTTLSHVSLFYNKVSTIKMFSKYWVHVFSAAEHFLRTLTAVYDCPIDGLTFCLITLSAGMALLSLCIS